MLLKAGKYCTAGAQINDLIQRHESLIDQNIVGYMAFIKRSFNIMLSAIRVLWLAHRGEPLKPLCRTLQQCFQVQPFLESQKAMN